MIRTKIIAFNAGQIRTITGDSCRQYYARIICETCINPYVLHYQMMNLQM